MIQVNSQEGINKKLGAVPADKYGFELCEYLRQNPLRVHGQLNDDYLTLHKCHNPALVYL